MSPSEIKEKIMKNNDDIASMLEVSYFTFNPKIHALLEENKALRSQCTHVFNEDGDCIYCGHHEDIWNG